MRHHFAAILDMCTLSIFWLLALDIVRNLTSKSCGVAIILHLLQNGIVNQEDGNGAPLEMALLGGAGISLGLMFFGKRVIM